MQLHWLHVYSSVNFNTGIYLCICHHSWDTEQFHHSTRVPCTFPLSHPSPPTPSKQWSVLHHWQFCLLQKCHENGVIQLVTFRDGLLSHSLMLLKFIWVICINSSFFSISEYYLIIQNTTVYLHYVHLWRTFGLFLAWITMNRETMNIHLQVSCEHSFHFLGKYLAVGLLGHVITMFNVLRHYISMHSD